MAPKAKHYPVMVNEVLSFLNPEKNKFYFDGTFGQGGYTKRILKKKCNVFAIDTDPDAEIFAKKLKDLHPKSFFFFNDKLSNVKKLIKKHKLKKFDGLVLDLGLSTTQISDADRGFSFMKNGPLDMRMNRNSSLTAERVINEFSENDLNEIFFHFGEERNARRIAKSIVEYRKKEKIDSTLALSNLIEKINVRKKIHPATRVFQALRIYVNDELSELENFLNLSLEITNSKSKIIILAFHSLEDKIVKNFFRKNSAKNNTRIDSSKCLRVLTKKPLRPSREEVAVNSSSRSAKMRVAEKL